MALDPGIRDLLQAIEEALAQQPAADDRAQLNELASRADLVRQAVKRALEDEPPATTATWVRVHAGLPPGSRAEPRHARQVQEQGPQARQRYHLWTRLPLVSLRGDRPKFGSGTTLALPGHPRSAAAWGLWPAAPPGLGIGEGALPPPRRQARRRRPTARRPSRRTVHARSPPTRWHEPGQDPAGRAGWRSGLPLRRWRPGCPASPPRPRSCAGRWAIRRFGFISQAGLEREGTLELGPGCLGCLRWGNGEALINPAERPEHASLPFRHHSLLPARPRCGWSAGSNSGWRRTGHGCLR